MTVRALFGFASVALCGAGARLAAQQSTPSRCTLVQQPNTRFAYDSLPNGGQVLHLGGGVLIKCPSRNITLKGDSAEQYPDTVHMIGNAEYDEPRVHVKANFLNYFQIEERIVAIGNVHANLPNGSTLVGPIATLWRAAPRIRPRQQIQARARPTITIVQKDSAGTPQPPTTVVAETVFMDGDSLLYAGGNVVITNPQVHATADSAFMDETKESMRLMREPKIEGKRGRPFTLAGDLIDLFSKDRKLQRVIARSNATAVSDSMTLSSDTIDLRVRNDLLDHAYVWGQKSRATAVSPSQRLLADSLDIDMPAQKVQLVHALRRAQAWAKPDTTRFHVEKPDTADWLRGDTIIAHFDSVPSKDTSKAPVIKQLVATGHAGAFYHLAASDTSEHRPAINHVTARLITINFDQQRKVSTVTAVDSVVGYYIEPKADTTTRRTNAAPGPTPNKGPPPKSIIPLPPPPKKP